MGFQRPECDTRQATDNAPAVLVQALGRRDELAEMIREMPVSVEQSLSAATIDPADLDRSVQQTFDGSPSTIDIRSLLDDGNGEGYGNQSPNEMILQEITALTAALYRAGIHSL